MSSIKKALITSCSNKFFPSVLNLIGSIKKNFPDHPEIFIYDLGLFSTFKKELASIKGVTVIEMPPFCSFWRACYTWKTYIFAHPIAELNLYLDAGCEVYTSLDHVFSFIDQKDYFAVEQGRRLGDVVPEEYISIFSFPRHYLDDMYMDAGIFGFKKNSSVTPLVTAIFDAALAGLALGFSSRDQWRNKGKNKSGFVRNCYQFRHDLTLVNLVFRRDMGDVVIHDVEKYATPVLEAQRTDEVIGKVRMNYKKLQYLSVNLVHTRKNSLIWINRLLIFFFMLIRRGVHLVKGIKL